MLTLKIKNKKLHKKHIKKSKTNRRKSKINRRKSKTNRRKSKTNRRKSKKLKGGSNPITDLFRSGIYQVQNFGDKIMGNYPLSNSPYPSDQPHMLEK